MSYLHSVNVDTFHPFCGMNFSILKNNISKLSKDQLVRYKLKIYGVLSNYIPCNLEPNYNENAYNIYILFTFMLTNDCIKLLSNMEDKHYKISIAIERLKPQIFALKNKNQKDELLNTFEEMKKFIDLKSAFRRSDRLKQAILKKKHEDFKKCGCSLCLRLYNDLTYEQQEKEDPPAAKRPCTSPSPIAV
jgi:hypothetical protein